ncbi:hypothetical protein [uncultured Culturomica sp.]|uniref:hypothetical protein n=1 Tax=uncultured Culturomica sp. TaxID=1926654 RepID=UPI000338A5F1|nr:hypothetical protein [uncultured Culturomica sp.]CCZ09062.1 unknown [Odoribacter sp. CAG:788]
MKKVFWCIWLLWFCIDTCAQGKGGGIYLHDGGSCVGSVVYQNQAQDGFGIAGGNARVINTTVIANEKLKVDTTRVAPGYIYCLNGEIVDTVTYESDGRQDAIGIVYWVRGDINAVYPKGAAIALQEFQGSWGAVNVLNISGQYELEDWGGVAFLKDTACYGNTLKMEQEYTDRGYREFEAGHICYGYRAEKQVEGIPRWCLPTYLYLRRIFNQISALDASLRFLKRVHPGLDIDMLGGKSRTAAWYWSSNDGLAGEHNSGCVVNFVTGAYGRFGSTEAEKTTRNNVRPIFVY